MLTLAFADLDDPKHSAFVETLLERAPAPVRLAMLSRFDEDTDPRWILTFAKTAKGSDSRYLTALARLLQRIGHVAAEPVLLSILLEHSTARGEEIAALSALGELGTPASLPHLETLRAFANTRSQKLQAALTDAIEQIEERLAQARSHWPSRTPRPARSHWRVPSKATSTSTSKPQRSPHSPPPRPSPPRRSTPRTATCIRSPRGPSSG